MIKRLLFVVLIIGVALGLQSNEVSVTALRVDALKGLNVEVGYEKEMAAWAYYRITGESSGITKDYDEAVRILIKLVNRDINRVESNKFTYVVEGYNMLGNCYENGYGVTKDIDKAKKYWKMAAEFDNDEAQAKLEKYSSQSSLTSKSNFFTETVNGVSFKMIYVEGGTFKMGAQKESSVKDNYDPDAKDDESPVHQVTLSDYYMGEFEVTQELWEAVMGYSGRLSDGFYMRAVSPIWPGMADGRVPTSKYGKGSNYPAYYISYDDIVNNFIPRLNKLTGKKFRLPTEAEWEYAARGGKHQSYYLYSGSDNISSVAWYRVNARAVRESSPDYGTHLVGTKSPNELGLYDMSGNVWEWCSDRYGKYSSYSQTNPTGPTSGSYRVRRGGGWESSTQDCRVANRGGYPPRVNSIPVNRGIGLGLRLVCVL